jgi:hypothetical protein
MRKNTKFILNLFSANDNKHVTVKHAIEYIAEAVSLVYPNRNLMSRKANKIKIIIFIIIKRVCY